MKSIPDMLEQDEELLLNDPAACITKNVIKMDEDLLGGEMGRMAMTCGTTSTVFYMRGSTCWVGCSGDSRAVKGYTKGGMIKALDLSNDHKPDLPEEMARILEAGGTVSPGGGGRPSRVWAHGRIGLAMSRSIGDGECKAVGVIPNPEVQRFDIFTDKDSEDGDQFIILASDGVWEFISSQEACEIVAEHKNATDACSELVAEAAARWKRYEGNYRDDITAIIAFLPFLEEWEDEEPQRRSRAEQSQETAAEREKEAHEAIYINMGIAGLSTVTVDEFAGGSKKATAPKTAAAEGEEEEEDDDEEPGFVERRLSVHNPYDEDWNDAEDGGGDDDDADADAHSP